MLNDNSMWRCGWPRAAGMKLRCVIQFSESGGAGSGSRVAVFGSDVVILCFEEGITQAVALPVNQSPFKPFLFNVIPFPTLSSPSFSFDASNSQAPDTITRHEASSPFAYPALVAFTSAFSPLIVLLAAIIFNHFSIFHPDSPLPP